MIVRWGLDELPGVLDELGVHHPYLITTHRWLDLPLPVEPIDTWASSPTHEVERVAGLARGADVMLALGGGSAIDLGKAVSAQTGLPLVSIPTTYSGAEWTTFYGVRDLDRRMRGGGAGAHPAGIVYEPQLTLELPPAESCGTALNALAHCAEALYVEGHNDEADGHALAGRTADRGVAAAGARGRPATSPPAPRCSRAPAEAAPRSAPRSSRSATRWRRRSAAATGSRTAP